MAPQRKPAQDAGKLTLADLGNVVQFRVAEQTAIVSEQIVTGTQAVLDASRDPVLAGVRDDFALARENSETRRQAGTIFSDVRALLDITARYGVTELMGPNAAKGIAALSDEARATLDENSRKVLGKQLETIAGRLASLLERLEEEQRLENEGTEAELKKFLSDNPGIEEHAPELRDALKSSDKGTAELISGVRKLIGPDGKSGILNAYVNQVNTIAGAPNSPHFAKHQEALSRKMRELSAALGFIDKAMDRFESARNDIDEAMVTLHSVAETFNEDVAAAKRNLKQIGEQTEQAVRARDLELARTITARRELTALVTAAIKEKDKMQRERDSLQAGQDTLRRVVSIIAANVSQHVSGIEGFDPNTASVETLHGVMADVGITFNKYIVDRLNELKVARERSEQRDADAVKAHQAMLLKMTERAEQERDAIIQSAEIVAQQEVTRRVNGADKANAALMKGARQDRAAAATERADAISLMKDARLDRAAATAERANATKQVDEMLEMVTLASDELRMLRIEADALKAEIEAGKFTAAQFTRLNSDLDRARLLSDEFATRLDVLQERNAAAQVAATGMQTNAADLVKAAKTLKRAGTRYNPASPDFWGSYPVTLSSSVIAGAAAPVVISKIAHTLHGSDMMGAARAAGGELDQARNLGYVMKALTQPELLLAIGAGAVAGGALGTAWVLAAGLKAYRDAGAGELLNEAETIQALAGKVSSFLDPKDNCARPVLPPNPLGQAAKAGPQPGGN